MRLPLPHILLLLLSLPVLSGCTAIQLQKSSTNQAKTIASLYEQQVLDNLAVFVTDASATPFFAVPADGVNQVSDSASVGAGEGVLTGKFWSHITFGGGRTKNQSWGLIPVSEPQRLKLMQCAYRRAVGANLDECNNCCELEKAWEGPSYVCGGPCDITCGWVKCSSEWKDVPKCCCEKYGKHCGVYVWVDPCNRQEFSKLVFKIVEYASGKPYQAPTKEVRYYLNADGTAGTIGNHSKVVIAQVDADQSLAKIEKDLQILNIDRQIKVLEDVKQRAGVMGESDASAYLREAVPKSLMMPSLPGTVKPKTMLDHIDAEIQRLQESKFETMQSLPTQPPKDFGEPAQSKGIISPQLNIELNRVRSGR